MSLLPRSHTQFQLKSYWDNFFSKRSTPFEWYGKYTDLCHVVHKYVKSTSKTLVVGCGNSKLSEDMYDAGIVNITNIDISEVVIKKMGARNFEKRPRMVFTQMDMLSMSFSDGSFDCVLDKGTLDAIYSNTDDETVTKVNRMWDEVGRVLKVGGRYMCITLAQEHILSALLERFSSGWLLRAHKVVLGEDSGSCEDGRSGVGASLPVIVFVFTKMLTFPGKPAIQVLEVVGDDGKCVRCEDVEGVREFVKAAQQHAMLLHHLKTLHPDDPGVQVHLWSEAVTEQPRYTFTTVDLHKTRAKNGPFAIFIVPQGRESEWIFSSDAGVRGLAEQSCYQRLVIVTMHIGHEYGDLQHVKKEVSGSALTMLQTGVPRNVKLPVLSTGEGVGCRVCLCDGVSSMSGRWRVEECGGKGGEGERVRRLVFMNTSHLVQTEMRLRPAKPSQRKKKSSKKRPSTSVPSTLVPDPSYLTFTYHRAMLAALSLTPCLYSSSMGDTVGVDGVGKGRGRELTGRVLIVGLGGGALPTYFHKYLPHVSVEVCELDSDLVQVAERWFGFKRDSSSRMTVHIEDGVGFVKGRAASTEEIAGLYSAVVLDVDSKDLSAGISSPPLTFVDPAFLTAVRSLLTQDGVLVSNVAARNQAMKVHILQSLQQVYPTVMCLPLQEDLNDVVIGLKECSSDNAENRATIVNGGQSRGAGDLDSAANQSPVTDMSTAVVAERIELKGVTAAQSSGAPLSSTCHKKSSSDCRLPNGNGEGVRRSVCDLVSVIGENGGDVEELESELIGFLMSKTIFTQ